MRGERVEGRFSVDSERESILSGTTKNLVHTVGSTVEWWYFDQQHSGTDPIYDVGSTTTGRVWKGPAQVPVINAHLTQGQTAQSERGFYNTDVLTLLINVDLVEDHIALYGNNAGTIPNLSELEINPDSYLRDRVTFRHEVWTPTRITPAGLIKNKFTLLAVDCNQVNPEELINDQQFAHYAAYNPFDPNTL